MGMENSWYNYRYFPTFSHYLEFSFFFMQKNHSKYFSSQIFLKNKRFFKQTPKEIGKRNSKRNWKRQRNRLNSDEKI